MYKVWLGGGCYLAKKNWHLPLKKRQKNSGTRYAPKFFLFKT
jgi:hypothetical protein